MQALGPLLAIPAAVFLFMLVILAILMPYYVYRMHSHLKEINQKMGRLVEIFAAIERLERLERIK